MRYCINLPIGGAAADPSSLADLAALAESVGWDAVFVEDYIIYQNRQDLPTFDPWVALAAMAVRTSRIRLGTMVTTVARRRPWKLAREAVTLDHLSDGRLILGVGLGDSSDESLTCFGEETDIRTRASMVDEALEIITGLWTGDPVSYDGRHYRVREVACLPPPVQRPRIPIWIGGGYPNPALPRRAARWDGACPYKALDNGQDSEEPLAPEELRDLRRRIEGYRIESTPFDVVAGGPERPKDWELHRARIHASEEAGATWFSEWVPPSDPDTMRTCVKRGPLRVEGR
jgi:probable F420-dependent oxidoreductase